MWIHSFQLGGRYWRRKSVRIGGSADTGDKTAGLGGLIDEYMFTITR